ncbi:major facilitator superfamily MFS_1 [Kribbella flavida DSM 17836]|uniref:Major facilitator superfamily MFS_1 n=1 Tax=Kribbella flavida (strain DSM 17836 / JCM 10339 / NBRC 14399) TaxID=479435 RepID=D2PRL1_KRIFD|nr:MFS transporter [Kribbella flavida]ADB34929.1 major facilitator superfamily MFS_1 [Kribbella flavida DSM 17836]
MTSTCVAAAPGRTAIQGWVAAITMAVTVFTVVTAEMLPVGLLTPMGTALAVSEGTAGLSLTVTGLVAAVSAPVLPLVLGKLDRRTVLVGLMLLLAVASALAAWSPSFGVLVVARILTGIAMGGVWLLTVGLAPRLVPRDSVGPATALIFSGIAIASVLGIPAGTSVGELAGWRWAFGSIGVLSVVLAVALALLLPALPAAAPVRLADVGSVLKIKQVRVGLLLVALLVTAHFSAYTYVRPMLEHLASIGPSLISTLLLAYGVAGVAGNFVAGSARSFRVMLVVIAALLAAAVPALPLVGTTVAGAVVLLLIWGFGYGGVSVTTQAWNHAAAPQAPEASSALLVGVFNAAIALGAFTGGRVVDHLGTDAVPYLTGLLALTALAVLLTQRPKKLEA